MVARVVQLGVVAGVRLGRDGFFGFDHWPAEGQSTPFVGYANDEGHTVLPDTASVYNQSERVVSETLE